MRIAILTAAAAIILAVSPVRGLHAAAAVDLDHQSIQASQVDKSAATAESKQGKSAEPKSAKAKALRRAYAIRARMTKQKTQLAKAKKPSLKGKKQLAKSKKPSANRKKKRSA